uniref:Unannotated protein n=1 Tax=freshwater metagenome TaxID=449393 RepID=A0A6J5ZZE1_9ZZZZ
MGSRSDNVDEKFRNMPSLAPGVPLSRNEEIDHKFWRLFDQLDELGTKLTYKLDDLDTKLDDLDTKLDSINARQEINSEKLGDLVMLTAASLGAWWWVTTFKSSWLLWVGVAYFVYFLIRFPSKPKKP